MMKRLDVILADVIEQLGIEGAGRAGKSAHPRAAVQEEKTAAVRLVWENPTAMRKRRSEGSRPLLMIVCK